MCYSHINNNELFSKLSNMLKWVPTVQILKAYTLHKYHKVGLKRTKPPKCIYTKYNTVPLKVNTAQRERAALVEVCAPSCCIWF